MKLAALLALLAIDYAQTLQIVADGREINPLIGRTGGGDVPPLLYFGVVVTIIMVVRYMVRHPSFVTVVLLIQIYTVSGNLDEGYSPRAPDGPRMSLFASTY